MPSWVNQAAVRRARRTCLYDFLLSVHPDEVEREGDSLRLCCNHSVSIKAGYAGFTDFADGNTGNATDCLTGYLGYEFQDAVVALCLFDGMTLDEIGRPERSTTATQQPQPRETPRSAPQAPQRVFVPPEPVKGQYRHLYAYLAKQRGIPTTMIQQLIDWGLLYQAEDHNNIVFIDPARSFIELRGTNSFSPFHRVDFSDPAAFWWFKPDGPTSIATVAFICEGAIDAVSLYLLRLNPPAGSGLVAIPDGENALYCGIGGVANQQRIDHIKVSMTAAGCQTVIAVDNDRAGELCRQRNSDCLALAPRLKDWNEDYIAAQLKKG